MQFTSWWVENGEKNNIVVIFRLDGQPHEIIIKDTKYYVKELFSADKRSEQQLACWDLYVGASVDIFGKATVLKQADLKTAEWNKFYSSFLTEVSLIDTHRDGALVKDLSIEECRPKRVFSCCNQMKNTFVEELKKYERRALDPWLTRSHMTS